MSTPVCLIQSESDAMSPAISKCVFDNNHYALYFSRALIPSGFSGAFCKNISYYQHLGIYAYRQHFLTDIYPTLAENDLQKTEDLEMLKILGAGYKIKVAVVPNSQSIGVNTPEDIKKVENFLCQ